MARLVKSLIGGITSKVTGTYDTEDVEDVKDVEDEDRDGNRDGDGGIIMEVGSGEGNEEEEEEGKLSCSSEEDNEREMELNDQKLQPTTMHGTLSKWTNYLSGWQDRHVVVRDGILSYYKSEIDLQYGCRGSLSLQRVRVCLHEFDQQRFDIRAHDCTYFFRANSVEDKEAWIDAIQNNKKYLMESGFGKVPIIRQGSILSLSGLSQASTSSFKTGHDLHVKLAEMETYREILCKQIDLLQVYFDTLIETNGSSNINDSKGPFNGIENSTESIDELPEESNEQYEKNTPHHGNYSNPSSPLSRYSNDSNRHHGNGSGSAQHSPMTNRLTSKEHRRTGSDPFAFKLPHIYNSRSSHGRFLVGGSSPSSGNSPPYTNQIDFKGEAITFKATTAGILSSLAHCIDIMSKREDYWQKKFEKEQERRRKAERAAHSAINGPRVSAYEYSGPDMQEGPHSTLNEEEFFDAVEMAYQEDESDTTMRSVVDQTLPVDETHLLPSIKEGIEIEHKSKTGKANRLTPRIDEKVKEYAKYIFEPVDSSTGAWVLVHEDGDMKVHRREVEEDGVVVDPLKAQYIVKGLSAFEMANYFFEKDTRFDWEGTIEKMNVVETLTEDSIIFHQLHKRVWPSTQRESLFCSHMCSLTNEPRPENMIGHTWMVMNFSLDHDSVPPTSKLIRVHLEVAFVCQTLVHKPVEPGKESELTRDDVSTRIIYSADVNPGGWAPPSVVRTIAKREITKFLKKISTTCHNALCNSPLTL